MKMFFKQIGTEHDHPVTKSTDCGFLLLIQRAALLGLKDRGRLTNMQHRRAEEVLLQQYREHIKLNNTGACGND